MQTICCQPTVTKKNGDYSRTIQIPTFYLDARVQGIVSVEQAEKIVTSICNPTNDQDIHVVANVEAID